MAGNLLLLFVPVLGLRGSRRRDRVVVEHSGCSIDLPTRSGSGLKDLDGGVSTRKCCLLSNNRLQYNTVT